MTILPATQMMNLGGGPQNAAGSTVPTAASPVILAPGALTGAVTLGGTLQPQVQSGVVMLPQRSLTSGSVNMYALSDAMAAPQIAQLVADYRAQLAAQATGSAAQFAGGGAVATTSTLGLGTSGNATSAAPATGVTGASTGAASASSAIPTFGAGGGSLALGTGQVSYRQLEFSGGASGRSINLPQSISQGGVKAEVFVVRSFQRGSYQTEVLVPAGGTLTLGPGENTRVMLRVAGEAPGQTQLQVGGVPIAVTVGTTRVDPMAMMTWINDSNARSRGTTAAGVESVLQRFGVTSTGAAGAGARAVGPNLDTFYMSAAYEAVNRESPAAVAQRIVAQERQVRSGNPGAEFWVQVSDEQDHSAADVQGTVQWIAQLRNELAKLGSGAKLFVACQAQPWNLAYGSVVDGWATTQSSARSTDRNTARNLIAQAGQQYGRSIEFMQYPGNAYFDGGTAGSAAVSVASAGLSGADTWFVFAANNLDTLESGQGDEGRGNIGGLVAIDSGQVYATLALAEMEYGASLAGAAQATGATGTAGAQDVASAALSLDAYRHGATADFAAWEAEIAARLR